MARAKNYSTAWGQHGIVMWAPDTRDEVGRIAALASRLRRLFACFGKKALAKAKALRVGSPFKPTGEQKPMKDRNGNNAFVRIGSVAYISAAHVASTITDFTRSGNHQAHAHGSAKGHKWHADMNGEFLLETSSHGGMFTSSTNLPTVEAFLEAPKIGELKYDIKIDTSDAAAALETLQRAIGDTKLGVDLALIVSDQRKAIDRAVLEVIEKEKRQGGLLWDAGHSIAPQGATQTPFAKPLDDLARESYDELRERNPQLGSSALWATAYGVAADRIKLRNAYSRGDE